jgi:hypothetical protein
MSHASAVSNSQRVNTAKSAASTTQPSGMVQQSRQSRTPIRMRREAQSPRRLKEQKARESSERFQRMNDLWGSPEGWGGNLHAAETGVPTGAAHRPEPSKQIKTLDVTPVKKKAEATRGADMAQAQSTRVLKSPRSPATAAASCIPHVATPSVALDVLKSVHAMMTSAFGRSAGPYKSLPGNADNSYDKTPNAKATPGSTEKKQDRASLTSGGAQLPSRNVAMQAVAYSPRRSEEVLSSEEQELKVASIFLFYCPASEKIAHILRSCAPLPRSFHLSRAPVQRPPLPLKLPGLMTLLCACSEGN